MAAMMTSARVQAAPAGAAAARAARSAPRKLAIAARPSTRCQAAGTSFMTPEQMSGQGELRIRFENGQAVLSLGSAAPAAAPAGNEKEELAELARQFELWNAALQTRDPEIVASMYAPDGVLLPTVSNVVRTDHASKVDYFQAFLQLNPFGTINESHVRFLTPDRQVGINSGVYTFDIVKDGQAQQVQARYSFVYRKINGVWKITEHHSSAMPEPVTNPLDEVAGLFEKWNDALQTRDPEIVASMYAPDGVLLPTVSNKVRTDHASKVDYFQGFLKLQPFGTINESHVRFLSPTRDLACNSGVYTFDIVKDGQPQKVQARYSFVYRKVDGQWKIAEHHSSAMPEPVELEVAEKELPLEPVLVGASASANGAYHANGNGAHPDTGAGGSGKGKKPKRGPR